MSTATRLSFVVSATCAVDVYALGDAACSDPTAPARPVASGFYTSSSVIRGTVVGSGSSVLRISKATAPNVAMAFYTTDPNLQSTAGATCSGTLTVTGGKLIDFSSTTCPAGTVKSGSDATLSCAACPTGAFCAATDTTSATSCDTGASLWPKSC